MSQIITTIENPNYVYNLPLMQSHNGGKVHFPGCGHRSLYVATLKGSSKLTRAEIFEKFGTSLCRYCFPELQDIAPIEAPEEKPADDGICPGTNTNDWKFGEPERHGYLYNNGGTCGHCNEWVGTKSAYNTTIRKHKIK